MSKTIIWVSCWSIPVKLIKESYVDDMGRWDEQYTRENGEGLSFKPNPLEQFQTKKACRKSYKQRKCKCD